MRDVDAFDYFMVDEGTIFISKSDSHPKDYLIGLPVYTPDEDGGRSFNGTSYAKTGRDGLEDFEWLEESHLSDTAANVPKDRVVEVRKPCEREDQILQRVDEDVRELYREVEQLVGGPLGVIGSHIYGLDTEESDVDIIVRGDSPEYLRNVFEDISSHPDLEPLDEEILESKSGKYSERFDISRAEALQHLKNPERRYNHTEIDSKISFIPVQEPGTNSEYAVPEPGESSVPVEIEGEVTDDSLSFTSPRIWSLETDLGVMDVLTDRWIYAGSYETGDQVRVDAELFEDSDQLVLNEFDHDISPV
ncbi:MAG: hypothetical protein ABEK10_01630 [Candidatus Nanosalina sp.]